MELQLANIPHCLVHQRPIAFICACSSCGIPNPFICADTQCQKTHAHPLQHIISISKLNELLNQNTASLNLLKNKTKEYYKEIRISLSHEIQKISQMMCRALEYKHTHPVISKIKEQKFNELNPQRIFQLISYLRGSRSERNSMEFVRNQIYEGMQRIQKNKKNLIQSIQFRKTMLFQMIDIKSVQNISPVNVNTTILESEQQFTTIIRMLQRRYKKSSTQWELLYRASDQSFSANSYILSIQDRSHLLMIFKTEIGRKFGCFLNVKVDKKEGWLCDGTGNSFIFSLDHNQVYPIKSQAKSRVKAAYIGQKGPQIGSGCDIYISNGCDRNYQSGSNLGGSYQLPYPMKYGSRQAQYRLAGQQNFKIIEYQVYQLH